ncbi:hypothetical protein ACFLQ5_03700 [Bacteroidota bacterium]
MNQYEACASICDSSGNLLFYTDGTKVWNKNHIIMPYGDSLKGNQSSAQVIIVKKPEFDSLYYILTLGPMANYVGFRYSEVDMTLQNGNGSITQNKNILISDSTSMLYSRFNKNKFS